MSSILHSLSKNFKQGTILKKIIYINILLFFLFSLLEVFSFIFQYKLDLILKKLYLPAENSILISQPWTFITYMFLHHNFLHLLFNMIFLHFAGKIFLEYLSQKQLISTYILGGISGGLLFVICYNYLPALTVYTQNTQALGSSAAVLAIMIAIATYSPNYSVRLAFIGFVKLKHIAIFCIILDILSIPKGNTGGHIAHLGGALFGYIYIKQLKKGKKTSIRSKKHINRKHINRFVNLFKRKTKFKTIHKRPKTDQEFNTERSIQQKEIDLILEKISKSGYESLNKKEKATLFRASKK